MSETRKLAAILVADAVGYSRLAGADEERTLARLRALSSDLIDPSIALHHGRIVKRTGDGSIIEFRSGRLHHSSPSKSHAVLASPCHTTHLWVGLCPPPRCPHSRC
jgi:class 3 adenylate cyclase